MLRRVGRLPPDRALDVAHQLCAGLAAAHERSVLHLDLKPANVMIDGRGRAMITDFGVARSAHEESGGEIGGTAAYMPPEQRCGGPLSVQSDLYALGLVMFEMFTGQHAHGAGVVTDSRNDVGEGEPLPPSRFARDIDPRIEDVILACLERDVAARPRSAIAVATALPGGEPLAAALNAGRIPSPEMVAAARQNALRPAVAWTLAGCLVAGVGAISFLTRDELRKVAPRRSPPVLVARAQEVIRSLGYNRAPADSAYWFTWKRSYREQATDRDVTFRTNEAEPPGGARLLRFVYRESPDPLLAGNLFGRVTYRDPPAEVPGMVDVNLDTEGRLLRFVAVPGMREQPVELPPSKPSWSALLERAELQANELVAVAPRCTPPVAHDTWMEWETRPVEPIERLRVTAAAFDGRPVYFDMDTVREDPPAAHSGDATPTVSRLTSEPTVLFAIAAVALVSAILVARYRLLPGQDYRRGGVAPGPLFLLAET